MQNLRIKVLYGLYIDKFLRVNDEKSNKLPTDYKEVSFTIDFGEVDPITRLLLTEKKLRYLLTGPLFNEVHKIIQEELDVFIDQYKREYNIINVTLHKDLFNFRNSDGRFGMLVEYSTTFINFEYIDGGEINDIGFGR